MDIIFSISSAALSRDRLRLPPPRPSSFRGTDRPKTSAVAPGLARHPRLPETVFKFSDNIFHPVSAGEFLALHRDGPPATRLTRAYTNEIEYIEGTRAQWK